MGFRECRPPLLGRQRPDGGVDPLEALEVHGQPVEEDARHGVARHLGRRRVGVGALARLLRAAPAGDHQDALGPQVDHRADRRQLAHRPVAEIFTVDAHRRKHEGDRAGGHQVLDLQLGAQADALGPSPGLEIVPPWKKDRLSPEV
jgi:hypothetical protein